MKKVTLGLLCPALCLALILSCEIPQSITIRGNPGLRISLGSPFDGQAEELASYTNIDKITTMMGDSSAAAAMKIYEYTGSDAPADIKTFLVQYPIAKLELNLTSYIEEALQHDALYNTYQIPEDFIYLPAMPYLIQSGPTADSDIPLFSIPLADLRKLVKVVNGTGFGFKILNADQTLVDHLFLYIPAFGIGTSAAYTTGTIEGDNLKFTHNGKNSDDTFTPWTDLTTDGDLEIFAKLDGQVEGDIQIEIIFEWTSAVIDTTDSHGSLTGEYTLDEFDFADFFGGDITVEIKDVKGYIYVHTDSTVFSPPSTTMLLSVNDDPPIVDNKPLTWVNTRPDFGPSGGIVTGEIPTSSYAGTIDLAGILNSSGASKLDYNIKIGDTTINNTDILEGDHSVTIDLLIMLPMDFKISSVSSADPLYVKLDLEGEDGGSLFPVPEGDSDLFGRTADGDDLLNSLKSVTITLKDKKNTIIDDSNLVIRVSNNNDPFFTPKMVNLGDPEPSLTIDPIPNPFTPRFEILLRKDSGEDFATLRILRPIDGELPELDFSIAVEAQASIDYTIEF